jgi:pantoate--beta-alanine ligase
MINKSAIIVRRFMKICTDNIQLEAFLKQNQGYRKGFVPTMGALHAGHVSLLVKARQHCDCVISSVFVNPTQFTDKRDLENYPRMPKKDAEMLEAAGCDCLYMPGTNDVYPPGYKSPDFDFGFLEKTMEGHFRPGHFKGVTAVVHRLFNLVKPDEAFFGEKDFQQLAIIRRLAHQFHPEIKITGCPTLRESDGLAMSSRNLLLTAGQRQEAPVIYHALLQAGNWLLKHTIEETVELVKQAINKTQHLRIQYFEIVNPETLESLKGLERMKGMRGCIAVLTGGPRLIDNMEYDT